MTRLDSNHPALTVGQEVVVCRSGSWETHYAFGYRVTKVTPSGQFTIQLDCEGMQASRVRRFNKDGDELGEGKSEWRSTWIDTDVAGIRARIDSKAATRAAAEKLQAVDPKPVGKQWGKTYLMLRAAELRAALDAADAAIAGLAD